jgi:flagellar hook assembly protein FlgD
VPVNLSRDRAVEIAIFSLVGQRVAVLRSGWLPAGQHRFGWNGQDTKGRAVATGVYLLRAATTEGRQATRKLLLLR